MPRKIMASPGNPPGRVVDWLDGDRLPVVPAVPGLPRLSELSALPAAGLRSLDGLADFAIVEPCLSTAAKSGITNSTPSATCSTATPGNHPDLNPPDNRQRPAHVTSRR